LPPFFSSSPQRASRKETQRAQEREEEEEEEEERKKQMRSSVASLGRRAVRESFVRLTTKLTKKSGYYKGKNSISPGWHEKKANGGGRGRFVLLDWKRPTYVIPEGLKEFKLKPYVAKGVTK
jgi:NADPH-dependent glutamate synthase beta subunit-like oxidoreductase